MSWYSSDVSTGDEVLATQYNNLRKDASPVGVIVMFGSNSIPTQWVICNGQSLSTTTYDKLFAVIGYTYGGSGSSFDVPDFQDRFPKGKSGSTSLGDTGGSNSITLIEANLPAHMHSISDSGTHTHSVTVVNPTYNYGTPVAPSWPTGSPTTVGPAPQAYTTTGDGNHNHGTATGGTGSGSSVTIPDPLYLTVHYLIKY